MPDGAITRPKQIDKQREFPSDAEAVAERGTDREPLIPTPEPSELDAEKRRSIKAAGEAECSEDEADIDAPLKRIAKPNATPRT